MAIGGGLPKSMDGGSGRSSPCPPSSSKDKSNDVPMPDVEDDSEDELEVDEIEEDEEEDGLSLPPLSPPKRVLEPLPTFTTDWRRETYFTPSFAPPSPPASSSSAFLRSPPVSPRLPSCSSVLYATAAGESSGPGEVRGREVGWRGEPQQQQPQLLQPQTYQLPPIHAPAVQDSAFAAYRADKQVPPKKRGKRLGVAPVPCKKSTQTRNEARANVLVGVMKKTSTTTTTTLSPPASPPASSSYCRSPPMFSTNVVPVLGNTPQTPPAAVPTLSQQQSALVDNGRKRVTPAQLLILEQAFEQGMIPDLARRKELALKLGFTERRVQIWFQNRRAKMKKDNQKSSVFIINCGIDSFKN